MTLLRVGTDCSGIEAPIEALRQLQIPHKHLWSSDIDKFVIQSIKANYEPEILFGDPNGPYPDGDITKRDNSILPDIDLYVAGLPCQPFSISGQRKGFIDKRGNVFCSCLRASIGASIPLQSVPTLNNVILLLRTIILDWFFAAEKG